MREGEAGRGAGGTSSHIREATRAKAGLAEAEQTQCFQVLPGRSIVAAENR